MSKCAKVVVQEKSSELLKYECRTNESTYPFHPPIGMSRSIKQLSFFERHKNSAWLNLQRRLLESTTRGSSSQSPMAKNEKISWWILWKMRDDQIKKSCVQSFISQTHKIQLNLVENAMTPISKDDKSKEYNKEHGVT